MEGQASGTPFMVAGYLITWVVLVWYAWRLERRFLSARRVLTTDAEPPAGAGTSENG